MDFEYVLGELMARVEGAVGILLLDEQGECVDAFGSATSIHDIKVLGAYQGIFLQRLRTVLKRHDLGDCLEVTTQIGGSQLLTVPLPDGYYLTMVLGDEAVVGVARHELTDAARRIGEILF